MRSPLPHLDLTQKVLLSVGLTGALLCALGLTCAFWLFPLALDSRIYRSMDLWDPASAGRAAFETAPFPVYLKAHVFEVTNPLDTRDGKQPSTVDNGPYTYRMYREKVDISTEGEGPFISYGQTRRFEFMPEMSCEACQETDEIMTINAPLMILVSVILQTSALNSSQLLTELNVEVESSLGKYNDALFINKGVSEILFSGVLPGSLQWAFDGHPEVVQYLPARLIDSKKGFSLFDLVQPEDDDEEEDGLSWERPWFYEVNTGSDDLTEAYSIVKTGPAADRMAGDLNPFLWWRKEGGYQNSNSCNRLKGTDGFQFSSHVKDEDRLWVFQPATCRSTFYEMESEGEMDDVDYLRFVVPVEARDISTKDNLGFCMEYERRINWNSCAREESPGSDILNIDHCLDDPNYQGNCLDAAFNLRRCYDQAPFTFSNPHFFQSSDTLWTDVDGLTEPEFAKHGSFMDVEPETGSVLNFSRRHQINIPLENVEEMQTLANVRELVLPFLWLEETGVVGQEGLETIKEVALRPKKILDALQWTFVGVGMAAVLAAAFGAYWTY